MPAIEYLAPALVGWAIGILINYLSDVLPEKRRLTKPFCLKCCSMQPVINYIFHLRRCENCHSSRSFRTYLVEVSCSLISIYLWGSLSSWLGWLVSIIVIGYFFLVIVIDFEHRLILHWVSLFGVFIGLGFGSWQHGFWNTLLGGAGGFLGMLLLYLLGIALLRIINRMGGKIDEEEAVGFGDVNLSAVIGLMLGWPGVMVGIVLSIFLFAVVGGIILLVMAAAGRYKLGLALPFGPFLAGSALILLFFQKILYAFLGWG